MSAEKIFWTEFLQLYQESPALWKIKSPDYSNRIIKAGCYEKLIEKLRERHEDANREMVVKKINTFRSAYRKELKKIEACEKSGAGTDDIYEPTLWYYPLLSFLKDQEESAPSICTFRDEAQEQASTKTTPTSHKARKRKISEEDNLIKLACEHLQAHNMNSIEQSSDPDDIICRGWAAQLREMGKEQKLLARKIIADVLFQGNLGNLNTLHVENFPNFLQPISQQSRPSSTISFVSSPSEEITNDPIISIATQQQHSIQDYFTTFANYE